MRAFQIILACALTCFFSGCKSTPTRAGSTGAPPAGGDTNGVDQLTAVLWFQRAAETKALFYQAYSLAQKRVEEALPNRGNDKLAVILDIDETILDNSPFQAYLANTRQSYKTNLFDAWAAAAKANALAGALDFVSYAASNRVEVFYVSNRGTNEFADTAKNLKEQGFPMVDPVHLRLQNAREGKEPRRVDIAKEYRIVLLVGDNLGDFSAVFEGASCEERSAQVEKHRNDFGARFILLPNPMYGGWEDCFYSPGSNAEEKAARRRQLLREKSWR